jgi:hypothetical protein
MNKTFPVLAREIKKEDYLNSLKFAFHQKTTYKRFPDDTEFKTQFVVKDVYNFNRRSYLLEKLENFDRKELVELDEYTIEHIMPQDDSGRKLSQQWKDDLGERWQEIHNNYLHTIGNLTLTGYNSELSDRSFQEKKTIKGGFSDSPIRLNKRLAGLEKWNKDEIEKRADELADLALKIWIYPTLEPEILEKFQQKREAELIAKDSEEEHEVRQPKKKYGPWSVRLEEGSPEAQKLIQETISKINSGFDCYGTPYTNWYFFYTDDSEEEKFAILSIGKNVANLYFRIDPETFSIEDEQIRKVKGWFWSGAERRVGITSENSDLIMECVRHAYETTKKIESEEI